MSRAQAKFEAGESLSIDSGSGAVVTYRVAEHPALPGIPYVQRGARGFVIQLVAPNGEKHALKYFKLKYRVADLLNVAQALVQFADLPGMRAARRVVFSRPKYNALLTQYPALEYGVLMPWLPGMTWYDVITKKMPITVNDSLTLAQQACRVLAKLEARGAAHCDIAGANVMIDKQHGLVELVDIEEMFGAGMPSPVEVPAGQDGYQHKESRQRGQWSQYGDRFSAAVLIAEILAWSHPVIRKNSADEHYFSAMEMQDPQSPRFRLLIEVLHDQYGEPSAELFRAAWHSAMLADCPPMARWAEVLEPLHQAVQAPQSDSVPKIAPAPNQPPASQSPSSQPRPLSGGTPGSPVVSGRRAMAIPTPAPKADESPEAPRDNPSPETSPAEVQPAEMSIETPIETPTEIQSAEATPESVTASNEVQSQPVDLADRISLDGTKLCRNCGAQNKADETFCVKCGFYIGTGARKPINVALPVPGSVQAAKASGKAPASVGTAPQQVLVKRDPNDIISARRFGGTQGTQHIERRGDPPSQPVPANSGSWIVPIVIVFTMIAVLILLVLGG
jgi:serine/threonine protein kinase